jgi:phage/plasmid-associated DNA primase
MTTTTTTSTTADMHTFMANHFTTKYENKDVYLAVAVKEKFNKKTNERMKVGAKSSLTVEQLYELQETGMVKNASKKRATGEVMDYKEQPLAEADYYELRPMLTPENVLCLDIDGIWETDEEGNALLGDNKEKLPKKISPEEFWALPYLPEWFHKLPYTESRSKKLPHFYFRLSGVPTTFYELPNIQNIAINFNADLLNKNAFEKKNATIHNYDGTIPVIDWIDFKQILQSSKIPKNSGYKVFEAGDGPTVKPTKAPATKPDLVIQKDTTVFRPEDVDLSQYEGLTEIEMLLEISKDAFCSKGTHCAWHKIGQIIKHATIDNAEDGLRYFKNWTMKYGTENKKQECENHYNYNIVATPVSESKKKDKNRVSIGTLHYMVKELNPEKYEFVRSSCGEPYVKIDWGRLTDAMFAETMAQLYFQENVIFIGKEKKTKGYFYTGVYWEELGENNAVLCQGYFKRLYDYYQRRFAAIKDSFDEEGQKAIQRKILYLESSQGRKNIIDVFRQEKYVRDVVWNKNDYLVAFTDCVYDLQTGLFIEPRPEQYINVSAGYALGVSKRDGVFPTLDMLLAEFEVETAYLMNLCLDIMGSAALTHYLMKTMATFLKQLNDEQVAYFWLGSGRNGKGTLTHLLMCALGSYFGELSINYYTQHSKGEDTPNSNLCAVRNCRVLNTSEIGKAEGSTEKAAQFKICKYKKLTGGDMIDTRNLNSSERISFQAGKPLIQTNEMADIPGIENPDNASLRDRTIIVPFPFVFKGEEEYNPNNAKHKKRDNGLKEKLSNERYKRGWMLLLMKYYKSYKSEGLKLPTEVVNARKDYFEQSNREYCWLRDNLQPSKDVKETIGIDDLVKAYPEKVKKSKLEKALEEFAGSKTKNPKLKDEKTGEEYRIGTTKTNGYLFLHGYTWINMDGEEEKSEESEKQTQPDCKC